MEKPIRFIVVTDTHLGHRAISENGYRPLDFEQQILENLKKFSRPQDVLIHLGDVSFTKHSEWTKKLFASFNGIAKWLLLGNHDRQSYTWYIRNGWNWVGQTMTLVFENTEIILSHKPIKGCIGINVHGHLHTGVHRPEYHNLPKQFKLVSLEKNKYKPVLLKDCLNQI